MNDLEQKNEDKPVLEKRINTKRRIVSRAGMVTPLIMSLMNKTALGSVYQCSISGAQSGNVSSHSSDTTVCGVGFSPGAWKEKASQKQNAGGGPDGNIQHWLSAEVIPFSIRKHNGEKQIFKNGTWIKKRAIYNAIQRFAGNNATATTFSSIFGSGFGSDSVWQVLHDNPDSLEFHAIADYLNAKLNEATGIFNPVYEGIAPSDIVGLYQLGISGSGFTTSSGFVVPDDFDVLGYLVSIHD